MNNAEVFRQLHHVCIVVRDLEKSIAYYESLGIGPWEDYPPLEIYKDNLDVSDRDGFFKLRYKLVNLDNIQIQLVEPSEGKTPQRIFLDTHGEGVFHLGFTVPDADASEADAAKLGIETLMKGRRPDGSGFTYFDTADKAGVVLETRAITPC